jgi:hypothetical protein
VDSLFEQVESAPAEAEEFGESLVDLLEEIISENSGSVLHPNHWVLTTAAQNIIHDFSSKLEQLSIEELDRFIAHCEHLLSIRNVVSPGISTEKGEINFHNINS